MTASSCPTCGKTDFLEISTYKRDWYICRDCGTGHPIQRDKYPLRFLQPEDLKKNSASAEKMYDYFSDETHLAHAKQEAADFYERYLKIHNLDFVGKSVLDVSGGNGNFVGWFQEEFGAKASLSEYNKKTVEFAEKHQDFQFVREYDMNNDNLLDTFDGNQFDIIIAKACIMFSADIKSFSKQLLETLKPGGMLILSHCVQPTLGTLVRVQLDEFSYFALRQPDVIQSTFEESGFKVYHRTDETDPDLYVYDHDLLPYWMALHYFYEIKGARKLAKERLFNLPARDRRRSTFILTKAG